MIRNGAGAYEWKKNMYYRIIENTVQYLNSKLIFSCRVKGINNNNTNHGPFLGLSENQPRFYYHSDYGDWCLTLSNEQVTKDVDQRVAAVDIITAKCVSSVDWKAKSDQYLQPSYHNVPKRPLVFLNSLLNVPILMVYNFYCKFWRAVIILVCLWNLSGKHCHASEKI